MNPHVTVGIPFFNSAATLLDSIRSVFAQTFTDWELLLVDDGSTDASLAIAESIDDPRVLVISDGINRGLVYRLNQMVSLANAPYFARMDADDLMHPERLTRQLEFVRSHPEIEIVGSAAFVIDREGKPYGVRGDRTANLTAGVRAGFIHPTVLAKTKWLRANPYDFAYVRAEDMELWHRADPDTACARLIEPLLFYREPLEFHPAKYRSSCRTARKIARRYAVGGRVSMLVTLAGIYGKEALHLALNEVGMSDMLIRRRNRPCELEELQRASRGLQQIACVEVPVKQAVGALAAI
jgi:glycosyltransferase involved in cell wall biosynthesis